MLWVPGVGEVPISYSAIGPRRAVEHTVRAVGASTVALAALEPGDLVGVRGPFGRGWPIDDLAGRDLLVIAGGLGSAPLRPVIEAAGRGELAARSVRILVGSRRPETLLFAELIEHEWSHLDTQVTVDAAPSSWQGAVGPVTVLFERTPIDAPTTLALVCGPEIMMTAVARRLVDAGVDASAIHVSLERNMQCGVGHCGHCQLGPLFTCVDGPVVDWAVAAPLLTVREL